MPTSTVSGTLSDTAPSMRSRTSAAACLGFAFRRFEEQLVVDGEDHARAQAVRRQRGVQVDHRALEDVGRRALDRHVHRLALGLRPGSDRSGS